MRREAKWFSQQECSVCIFKTSVLSVGRRRALSAGRTNVYSARRKERMMFTVVQSL
jgi:hypothetical protein